MADPGYKVLADALMKAKLDLNEDEYREYLARRARKEPGYVLYPLELRPNLDPR